MVIRSILIFCSGAFAFDMIPQLAHVASNPHIFLFSNSFWALFLVTQSTLRLTCDFWLTVVVTLTVAAAARSTFVGIVVQISCWSLSTLPGRLVYSLAIFFVCFPFRFLRLSFCFFPSFFFLHSFLLQSFSISFLFTPLLCFFLCNLSINFLTKQLPMFV